jgi:hypothetical protein
VPSKKEVKIGSNSNRRAGSIVAEEAKTEASNERIVA